ncbi:uncharacterized protein LOC141608509 [Silene latifolia]|uniref:uncharacterized protein LOC141608509 n=1 Tax=Silene latifolia TaxID=37657 RepID=UPI003D76B79B
MDTVEEELAKKIQVLEDGQAELREMMYKFVNSRGFPLPKLISAAENEFTEREYLNVLECMGQAVHIYDLEGQVFYWNRSAENLYGYTAAEAIGRETCGLLVSNYDMASANVIRQRCTMGETWTGQFPVMNKKMGRHFTVIATNTPFYDDDGTLIGSICVSCESKPFKDVQVSISDPQEEDICQDFIRPRRRMTSRLGLDADHPQRTAFAPKITQSHADSIGEGDQKKPSIHKMITSKTEAWICKTATRWSSWKGTERESSRPQKGRYSWPWTQSEQDYSNQVHSAVKSEITTNKASGSWSLFNVNSSSSASSCSSGSSSCTYKLDDETDSLNYEIMWEDLTFGEQIGQGSCGTVYHRLWYGSDVAIKVFSKQEYSEEVISSFRQEVSLMKRLRHPNILLFMGAVTSPQRLCIVTEFLPRGSLFRLLQRSKSKLDWRRRIHMALDIARGMNYLHNCNPPIVHRDLKSSNLLVDKNWSVKVADFGLSRVKHETYLTTKSGKGTPQWMAPEVLQNERSNEKSDLYSFGVVLWELATQKVPWENLNAMQVIGAVGFMNQRLNIPDDVDPMWASMIESCWHSEPQSRPTFQELLEKLKNMQKQYAIQSLAARVTSTDLPPKQVWSPLDL